MPTNDSPADVANLMSAWYSKKLLSQLEAQSMLFTREYMNIPHTNKVYLEDILCHTQRLQHRQVKLIGLP